MISLEEVKHIAKLARIEFSGKELKELQKELSSILDYFNKLKEVDIKGIKLNSRTAGAENVMRKDVSEEEDLQTRSNLLKLAPRTKENFIKVKSVL